MQRAGTRKASYGKAPAVKSESCAGKHPSLTRSLQAQHDRETFGLKNAVEELEVNFLTARAMYLERGRCQMRLRESKIKIAALESQVQMLQNMIVRSIVIIFVMGSSSRILRTILWKSMKKTFE